MLILKLFLISLLPIITAVALYVIKTYTKFYDLSYKKRQIIIGIIFGLVAIGETELGQFVEVGNGLTINVSDSAPLLAGLLFGAPAGIISGVIGGIERFVAAYWGRGFVTQWASSLTLIFGGLLSAFLRKYMFEDKRPGWGFAFVAAVVIEVLHCVLVFITNINNSVAIISTIKAIAAPVIIAVCLSVAIPTIIIQFIARNNDERANDKRKISNQVKWWLLGSIVVCYLVSNAVVFSVTTKNAYGTADQTFELTINDVSEDVRDNSNRYMKDVLDSVMTEYYNNPFDKTYSGTAKETELRTTYSDLCAELGVYSIDIINKDEKGTWACSSDLGFNYTYDEINNPDPFYMTQFPGQSHEIHEHMMAGDEYFVQDFGSRSDTSNGGIIYLKYAAQQINDDFYLITCIDAEQFRAKTNDKIKDITSFRHVNQSGHILILDYLDNPISDETDYEKQGLSSGITLTDLKGQGKEYETIRGELYGMDCFYTYTTAETYTIVIMMPSKNVLDDRNSSFMLNSFMEILVFASLYLIIYFLLQKLVVNRVENINDDLSKIANGDLGVIVNEKSSIEFEGLSNNINSSVTTLKKYIEDAAKRIDDELAFAKTIQLSSLPSAFPAFPDKNEFDIFATMNTAKEVGGDFYDFYIIDNETLAFLIADVSGKGIPAAMFMMESKATIKNLAKSQLSPEEIISKANDVLAHNNDAMMFVTCWFGLLNFKTGHVKFANAGHNPPLIYRKGKGYCYLNQKRNIVLAAMEGSKFTLEEFDLNPGDKLYFYTDGVTEANRTDGVLYGEERLLNYLNKNKEASLNETLLGVKEDIDKFIEGADQFDDITMLGIEFKGSTNNNF